ncbi:sensor domain-containing protein [Paenibacillus macquariensis]|uniref:Sensor n=1 Tax=Paenibacillus macquariensis TaxID=948756 RepID=A0ABY1JUD3_9BACL|nr:sensor domain-containing protein [Paenibacillus macquariensis]MEC0090990.1 sensor domain-containing protein [Paenibacillus macquariensis]OAB34709.1 luciferase [Paenibacillus macquariensis subsp. macquariensis]SIQ79166.1 Putative sensor [Paenibacillus macquariensis]
MKNRLVRNMQNLIFLLLTFTTGLFYFCFYLISLMLGVSLSFTVIGIPLLTYVMRSTQIFVRYERIQTKIYTDISIADYEEKPPIEGSLWTQAKDELLDHRNWRAIQWLMQKLIIGIVCLFCAMILYIVPLTYILSPFLIPFGGVHFMNIPINTLPKSLLMVVFGGILVVIGSWLGNGVVRITGSYTRHMIKAIK